MVWIIKTTKLRTYYPPSLTHTDDSANKPENKMTYARKYENIFRISDIIRTVFSTAWFDSDTDRSL